jgi:hypothetical protein
MLDTECEGLLLLQSSGMNAAVIVGQAPRTTAAVFLCVCVLNVCCTCVYSSRAGGGILELLLAGCTLQHDPSSACGTLLVLSTCE